MFCIKCVQKVDDSAMFCPTCGTTLQKFCDLKIDEQTPVKEVSSSDKTNIANNLIKQIGVALTIIGLICGIMVIVFMVSSGEAFGNGKKINFIITYDLYTSLFICM